LFYSYAIWINRIFFQKLMNTVLAGKVDHASASIDDIAIFSNTIEENVQH